MLSPRDNPARPSFTGRPRRWLTDGRRASFFLLSVPCVRTPLKRSFVACRSFIASSQSSFSRPARQASRSRHGRPCYMMDVRWMSAVVRENGKRRLEGGRGGGVIKGPLCAYPGLVTIHENTVFRTHILVLYITSTLNGTHGPDMDMRSNIVISNTSALVHSHRIILILRTDRQYFRPCVTSGVVRLYPLRVSLSRTRASRNAAHTPQRTSIM